MENNNSLEKKEQIFAVVINTINGLISLYERHGVDGLYELTNPSLADLIKTVTKLNETVGELRKRFITEHGAETINEEEIELEDLELGVMYVTRLLLSVKRLDGENAEMYKKFTKNTSDKFNK